MVCVRGKDFDIAVCVLISRVFETQQVILLFAQLINKHGLNFNFKIFSHPVM